MFEYFNEYNTLQMDALEKLKYFSTNHCNYSNYLAILSLKYIKKGMYYFIQVNIFITITTIWYIFCYICLGISLKYDLSNCHKDSNIDELLWNFDRTYVNGTYKRTITKSFGLKSLWCLGQYFILIDGKHIMVQRKTHLK